MITVRDVMCEDVIVVSPDTSVREIAQTLVREAIGGVPVVESDGTILGVVSASDIVRVAAREPEVELGFAGALEDLRLLSESRRLAVASYISLPRSADVLSALRLSMCPYDVADCERQCGLINQD